MANIKEMIVPNISIHFTYLEDALYAMLHTILFVRAPNVLATKEEACNRLKPLVYAKCGPDNVDRTVRSTVQMFQKSMVMVDEGVYHGEILLSFFDKRETKEFLGFVTRQENIYFEKWKLSVNAIDSNYRRHDPVTEMQAYQSAYFQVTNSILFINEAVNQATDHVPLTAYDYEIQVLELNGSSDGEKSGDKSAHQFVSKLINSPAMFNTMG